MPSSRFSTSGTTSTNSPFSTTTTFYYGERTTADLNRERVNALYPTESEKEDALEDLMETVVTCQICGKLHIAMERQISGIGHGAVICPNCSNAHVRTCIACNEHFLIFDGHTHNSDFACPSCFDEVLAVCPECDSLCDPDEMVQSPRYTRHRMICRNCYDSEIESMRRREEEERRRHAISGHYGEPPNGWVKFGTGDIYAGFELEVDEPSNSNVDDIYVPAYKIIQNYGKWVINKGDSSLRNGFEIVTNPMTEDFIKDFDIEGICDIVVESGLRGHQTTTAGFHVHVNREAFRGRDGRTTDSIANAILIFERNFSSFLRLSRRSADRLSQWAARYNLTRTDIVRQKEETKSMIQNGVNDRYHAINLTNSRTIEFRFWRSSLNPATVRGMIDITLAIVKACVLPDGDTMPIKAIVEQFCGDYGKRYWNKRMPEKIAVEEVAENVEY